MNSGYHQVSIEKTDVWKITFKAKEGLFEWFFMPFGLTNAPNTFIRMMDDILRPFKNSFVVVYLDDIMLDVWANPGSTLVLQQNPFQHQPF
jgi:hypothetical protein